MRRGLNSKLILSVMRRLIADDVVTLAVGAELSGWALDSSGRPVVPSGLDVVVAGGLLADLWMGGLVTVHRDQVRGVAGQSAGDVDLDEVHDRIRSTWSTRTVGRWLRDIASGRPALRRVDGLRRSGVLAEYERRAGGDGGASRRVFLPDRPGWDLVLDEPRRVLRGGPVDDRALLLLTVLRAAGLHRVWFRDIPAAAIDPQFDALLAGSWLWPPMRAAMGVSADGGWALSLP
jgi:hypothetical protein